MTRIDPVHFEYVEEMVRSHLKEMKADKAFVVSDLNLINLTGDFLSDIPAVYLPSGEKYKNIVSVEMVWTELSKKGASRNSVIINLGGGMVSDIGGFAAATFKRGIRYINLPTTLLAAVDASIGGKTGVNLNGLKNEIGAFWQPSVVIPLTFMFPSLPEEEWLSGCGEVLKTAILAGGHWLDKVATDAFIKQRKPDLINEIVAFCLKFKDKIVSEDFKDHGRRRILNFGHTYGHALESLMLEKDKPIPHGVAVAYGIEYALQLSVDRQDIGRQLLDKYRKILKKYFPAVHLDSDDKTRIQYLMNFDKKNKKFGNPEFVLLGDI